MQSRAIRAALLITIAACLLAFARTTVHAQDTTLRAQPAVGQGEARTSDGSVALDAIVYGQPPSQGGGLLQSSRWIPNGSDYDVLAWDDFILPTSLAITDVQWRGGYDPTKFGSGGPVVNFTVAIYAAAANQPDVSIPPIVSYNVAGNAGETSAGMFGGTAMFDYQFTLPTPFMADAHTWYWLLIVASQEALPDWGLSEGTGGNGTYVRRIANAGDGFYQIVPGDAAFTLLGPTAPPSTATPTVTPTATSTSTATPIATIPVPTSTATATPTTVTHRLWFPVVLQNMN